MARFYALAAGVGTARRYGNDGVSTVAGSFKGGIKVSILAMGKDDVYRVELIRPGHPNHLLIEEKF